MPQGHDGDTVFFLSDYGLDDEFVGVVHAVLRSRAPGTRVIDLSHGVPPFDVVAGSAMLVRSIPYLGAGVVLAVVDPGVGGARRPVALQTAANVGPNWFVGPDNGLLVAAAEACGGITSAVQMTTAIGDVIEGARTFDGRDVFAPAVAALCTGADLTELGESIDPATLYRLATPEVVRRVTEDGGVFVRAPVTWVDRFGNVQLAADAEPEFAASTFGGHASAWVESTEGDRRLSLLAVATGRAREGTPGSGGAWLRPIEARLVSVFGDLGPGELGVLADANGRLAIVVREGSAATTLGVGVDDVIELSDRPRP